MQQLFRRGLLLLRANPRLFAHRLRGLVRHPLAGARALEAIARSYRAVETSYAEWWQAEVPHTTIAAGPLLSVIMPVCDPEPRHLAAAVESVLNQQYPVWELCIADDASSRPEVRATVARYTAAEPRIQVTYRRERGHIAAASNTALEMARGEFVVLLDHDDWLHPDALAEIAEVIRRAPEVDLIYSDEDKLDASDRHAAPFFKPAWAPSLLMSCNYITHLAAIRRSLALEVGGFREQTVGSQDHDLFLRVSERARAIAHIPRVLYSWRMAAGSTATATSAKPYAVAATRRALEDAVRRRALTATVIPSHLNGLFLTHRGRREATRVTASLILTGTGSAWQQVLKTADLDVRDVLYLDPPCDLTSRVHAVDNMTQLEGEYVLFLDADSSPVDEESATALVDTLELTGAVVVGGMTLVGDQVGQAGLVLADGQPHYAYAGLGTMPYRSFYLNLKDLRREVSAAWVGCAAMRRANVVRLGGWSPGLPPSLAMIDLCLRAWTADESTVYTPCARFRRPAMLPALPHVTDASWGDYIDPFSNPNLTPWSADGLPFRHGDHQARVWRAARSAVSS